MCVWSRVCQLVVLLKLALSFLRGREYRRTKNIWSVGRMKIKSPDFETDKRQSNQQTTCIPCILSLKFGSPLEGSGALTTHIPNWCLFAWIRPSYCSQAAQNGLIVLVAKWPERWVNGRDTRSRSLDRRLNVCVDAKPHAHLTNIQICKHCLVVSTVVSMPCNQLLSVQPSP